MTIRKAIALATENGKKPLTRQELAEILPRLTGREQTEGAFSVGLSSEGVRKHGTRMSRRYSASIPEYELLAKQITPAQEPTQTPPPTSEPNGSPEAAAPLPPATSPFQCLKCGRSFGNQWGLTVHNSKNPDCDQQKPKGPVECSVCHKTYATPTVLTTHMLKMHGVDQRSVIRKFPEGTDKTTCPVCQKKYKTYGALKNHLRDTHGTTLTEATQNGLALTTIVHSNKLLPTHPLDQHSLQSAMQQVQNGELVIQAILDDAFAKIHALGFEVLPKDFGACPKCGYAFRQHLAAMRTQERIQKVTGL